jgi:hypothetical protein
MPTASAATRSRARQSALVTEAPSDAQAVAIQIFEAFCASRTKSAETRAVSVSSIVFVVIGYVQAYGLGWGKMSTGTGREERSRRTTTKSAAEWAAERSEAAHSDLSTAALKRFRY